MIEHFLTKEFSTDSAPGKFAKDTDYTIVISENAKVYKPNGELLFCLITNGIPRDTGLNAIPFMKKCKEPITNRGLAAGSSTSNIQHKKGVLGEDGQRYKTNTHQLPDKTARALGHSSSVGFYDRYPRIPFCRTCRYTEQYPALWSSFLPLAYACSELFEHHVPIAFKRQKYFVDNTEKTWVIPKTVFTTATVNKNFRTAYHTDKGDLTEGFGVICVISEGFVSGGLLVFPKYRIAVKLDSNSVLLFDPHEIHGNTTVIRRGDSNRFSVVFYYREKVCMCQSKDKELERAKHFTQIRTMYEPEELDKLKRLKKNCHE